MVSLTLSIPEDIKKKMDAFPEINWSETARQAIKNKIEMLETFRKFTEKSTMTEEDAIRLGRELNKKVAKKYLK